jgi:flavin-dependent thymidylate synthase
MKNTVEFVGHYGGDITHALSAWTSTSRELTDEKIKRIPKLLKQLADSGHGTPFEKSLIHFICDTEVATHIHCLKHRIAVPINGESARYKELIEDKFYIPEDWEGIQIAPKHRTNSYIAMQAYIHNLDYDWAKCLADFNALGNMLYHAALEDLEPVLGRKRAKESARFFKTYANQTTIDISFDWRSFAHFYRLRHSPEAQREIYWVAEEMLRQIKEIPGNPFQHTIAAFGF